MKGKAIFAFTLLLAIACSEREISGEEIQSYKQNVSRFEPDAFEPDSIPYPKIDSTYFNTYFAGTPELKEYADHVSSVYVYSKNHFANGVKGITLMAQDDFFSKEYYLFLRDKDQAWKPPFLIAYVNHDEEWYDVTRTTLVNDSILKTNSVSCEILSQVYEVNYCKCDSVVSERVIKPSGDLVKTKEQKYSYQRRYN